MNAALSVALFRCVPELAGALSSVNDLSKSVIC
jgi:hypothetical protein